MDEELASAVDEALIPVVDELWAPIRVQLLRLLHDLELPPAPWDTEDLAALVRARAEGRSW